MAIESQGTKIEMGTGSGGAETITAIALGNPTILTSAAHVLVNGDIVTLSNFGGDDAGDINGRVCIVSHVTTDTFAVNFDSTGKTITDNTDAALPIEKANRNDAFKDRIRTLEIMARQQINRGGR